MIRADGSLACNRHGEGRLSAISHGRRRCTRPEHTVDGIKVPLRMRAVSVLDYNREAAKSQQSFVATQKVQEAFYLCHPIPQSRAARCQERFL